MRISNDKYIDPYTNLKDIKELENEKNRYF